MANTQRVTSGRRLTDARLNVGDRRKASKQLPVIGWLQATDWHWMSTWVKASARLQVRLQVSAELR